MLGIYELVYSARAQVKNVAQFKARRFVRFDSDGNQALGGMIIDCI